MLQQNAIVFYYFILLFLQLKSLYNFMGSLDPHNDSLNNNILDPTLTNMPSRDWNYIPGNIKTILDVFPCRTYHILFSNYSAMIPSQWHSHFNILYLWASLWNWKLKTNVKLCNRLFLIHSFLFYYLFLVCVWVDSIQYGYGWSIYSVPTDK